MNRESKTTMSSSPKKDKKCNLRASADMAGDVVPLYSSKEQYKNILDSSSHLKHWNFRGDCKKCARCGIANSDIEGLMMQCGKCKMAYYCGRKCFNEDIDHHKSFCQAADKITRQPQAGPEIRRRGDEGFDEEAAKEKIREIEEQRKRDQILKHELESEARKEAEEEKRRRKEEEEKELERGQSVATPAATTCEDTNVDNDAKEIGNVVGSFAEESLDRECTTGSGSLNDEKDEEDETRRRLKVGDGDIPEHNFTPEIVILDEAETVKRDYRSAVPEWVRNINSILKKTEQNNPSEEKEKTKSVPSWTVSSPLKRSPCKKLQDGDASPSVQKQEPEWVNRSPLKKTPCLH